MALTQHEDGSITDERGVVVQPATKPVETAQPATVDNPPTEPEKPVKTAHTRK